MLMLSLISSFLFLNCVASYQQLGWLLRGDSQLAFQLSQSQLRLHSLTPDSFNVLNVTICNTHFANNPLKKDVTALFGVVSNDVSIVANHHPFPVMTSFRLFIQTCCHCANRAQFAFTQEPRGYTCQIMFHYRVTNVASHSCANIVASQPQMLYSK